jgi:transposase
MQTVTTIGLDIAKSVFQVHGVDATGQVLMRRKLKRRAVLTFFQKRQLFVLFALPETSLLRAHQRRPFCLTW